MAGFSTGDDIASLAINLDVTVNADPPTAGDAKTFDALTGVDVLDLSANTYADALGAFNITATAAGILKLTNANGAVQFKNFESLTFSDLTITLGTAAADTITGGSLDDNFLYGLGGNDTINGGAGADTMYGDGGDDIYIFDNTGDSAVEAATGGTDLIKSSVIITALDANVENLTLTGAAALDATGNALDNIIIGNSGNNTLNGSGGTDTLVGGAGDDIYVVNSSTDTITELATSGTDEVKSSVTYAALDDNVENLTLTGSAAINGSGNGLDNLIIGNSASNTLNGAGGNDTLDGGGGTDTLVGGAGNDIYIVNTNSDTITEAATGGTDEVRSTVTYTALDDNVEILTLTGSAAISGTGNALDNLITGNSANNTLNGAGGNDTLDGGGGTDTLVGGAGNDIYIIAAAGDTITEAQNGGTDEVRTAATLGALAANVEKLTLTGTAAINGVGNSLDNTIAGNSGNNLLKGGAGDDTISGGGGSDTLVLSGTSDDYTFTEISASVTKISDKVANRDGIDTVSGIENIQFSDATLSINSFLAGSIVVNLTNGNDTNAGTAANDVINGLGGDDILGGSAGKDRYLGGAGNDTYIINSTDDAYVELANEGTDLVKASVSIAALAANVENITLTGSSALNANGNELANIITGNSAANTLKGGGGDDTLNGGGGNDSLSGQSGNDIYVIGSGDSVFENANDGIDEVRGAFTITSLFANVENVTLFEGGNYDVTGNSLNNTITGNGFSNMLDGNGGRDTLIGGGGNDTYIIDSSDDRIVESAGGGNDTVQSSVVLSAMPDFVENLVLTGTAVAVVYGNAMDNRITGNDAANSLDGGAGNDVMAGDSGNDVYFVDSGGDQVIEAAGKGFDEIYAAVSIAKLSANVEVLSLVGTDSISGTGNALNNAITGNVGNNTINGGAGADRMIGGLGDDTLVVDNTKDQAVEFASQGTDTVVSLVDYRLGSNLENLKLIGGAIQATGNGLANSISGNAKANIIRGGGAADAITGGGGRDVFVYGSASESRFGAGHDTVRDFSHGADKFDLTKIDANGKASGNGAFHFIGKSAFDGDNGALAVHVENGNTFIEADIDGDGDADFQIALAGIKTVTKSDFLL